MVITIKSMLKPFLILQLRPEDEAADQEFQAFLRYGKLVMTDVVRVRMEASFPDSDLSAYSGVIVGGGPWNVSDDESKKTSEQKQAELKLRALIAQIYEHDIPFLGACYGFGALVSFLGGTTSKERYGENAGTIDVELTADGMQDPLLHDLPQTFRAMVGHKESCQIPPPGSTWLARSAQCPFHMIRLKQNIYATQFHPELDAEGICLRIDIYKHAGYFPPEEAESLKHAAKKECITVPMMILKNFVNRYRQ